MRRTLFAVVLGNDGGEIPSGFFAVPSFSLSYALEIQRAAQQCSFLGSW